MAIVHVLPKPGNNSQIQVTAEPGKVLTDVTIDGEPPTGQDLPPGPHTVIVILGDGFQYAYTIVIRANNGSRSMLSVTAPQDGSSTENRVEIAVSNGQLHGGSIDNLNFTVGGLDNTFTTNLANGEHALIVSATLDGTAENFPFDVTVDQGRVKAQHPHD